MAVASLVLGIISILVAWIPLCNYIVTIPAIVGLILGIVALVKANKEVQVKRLMDRDNISYEYAIKKIESQLPIEEKEKYANYIIDNSSDINNTYNQIENILKQMED